MTGRATKNIAAAMPPMRMVAMGSLIGHLIYGLVLGGAFAWLYHGAHHRAPLHA